MLQRIQSIYLGIAVIAGFLIQVLPLATLADGELAHIYKATGFIVQTGENAETNALSTWPVIGLAMLVTLVCAFIIFQYKKRKLQLKLCQANFLLTTALLVVAVLYIDSGRSLYPNQDTVEVGYGIGLICPIVILAMTFLARNAIKKDEELVRSADRIR